MIQKTCFLDSLNKDKCYGCEACAQICPSQSISMEEDEEGFRYPRINENTCVHCGLCRSVCPFNISFVGESPVKYAYGGYILDKLIRFNSTSGGAFTAIARAYCDKDYVIFGAASNGIEVFHSFVTSIEDLDKFRKSKYSQSRIGDSYKQVKLFLKEGKKVLFSGTPCQIAGLKSFLNNANQDSLLTIEVVCEGVPSPLYVRKMKEKLEKKYEASLESIDYRYKGKSIFGKGKWDFQQQEVIMKNEKIIRKGFARNENVTIIHKTIRKDRWFNPFWSIWLQHLMTRPSCYECKFAQKKRNADITLGDLWGVHIYCPDLYGENGGSSLVVCNTKKGKKMLEKAKSSMFGRELKYEEVLKYQSPLKKHIDYNPNRELFMSDLKSNYNYEEINKKWAKKPTLRLLWQKYVWGNRQKVALWRLFHKKERIQ